MLAVPDRLRNALLESDHVVLPMKCQKLPVSQHASSDSRRFLPVADMVPKLYPQDAIAFIISRSVSTTGTT
jgi:hypothetical protein